MEKSLYVGTDPAVEERRHVYNQEELFLMAGGSQKKKPLFRRAPWDRSAISPSHNLQSLPGKDPLSAGWSTGATGLLSRTVAMKL